MSLDMLAKETYPEDDVFYPDTDGNPMAESDFQRDPLIYCVAALKERYRSDPDVYVSGDLLVYYEKGNPFRSVAPDVFVVFGVPGHDRSSYKIWEEGKAPDVVIEIISESTWRKDQDNIRLYQQLGVGEYFMFDPLDRHPDPVLQGYRLDQSGRYQRIHVEKLPGGILKADSLGLGLELRVESGRLRLYDPELREYLFDYGEERQARLWERARAENEKRQAENEKKRAETEKMRAEQAESRVRQAEEEIRQLKAKLKALGH